MRPRRAFADFVIPHIEAVECVDPLELPFPRSPTNLDRQEAIGVLHVSFDVAFLDPIGASGAGTTAPRRCKYREAHLAMELMQNAGLVCSLDVGESNPFLDECGSSARVAVGLVASLFSQRITDCATPTNMIILLR